MRFIKLQKLKLVTIFLLPLFYLKINFTMTLNSNVLSEWWNLDL